MKELAIDLKSVKLALEVAEEARQLMPCNCSSLRCEGSCTHAKATALMRQLYQHIAQAALAAGEEEEKHGRHLAVDQAERR